MGLLGEVIRKIYRSQIGWFDEQRYKALAAARDRKFAYSGKQEHPLDGYESVWEAADREWREDA